MTIVSKLDRAFRTAISAALDIDADPQIGISLNPQFGDYQSNAAMGLVKILSEKTGTKQSPRAIAEQIKAKLDLTEMASEVTIAGPGFINIRLSPAWLAKQLDSLKDDSRLGIQAVPNPQTVIVDYSGPNIAKEMHVGHLRSTIIGDAISRVLEFQGNKIIRQNHIGDWGTQFGMLIAYARVTGLAERTATPVPYGSPSVDAEEGDKRASMLVAQPINDLEEFYRSAKARFDNDTAFKEQARSEVVKLQKGFGVQKMIWQYIVSQTRASYEPLYRRLSVLLDRSNEMGESFYNSMLSTVVVDLLRANPPIAKESQGAIVVPVPGFESPLMIEKSNLGGYLYGTTDLAAIRYRVNELHANRIIYVHDSRQAQHFSQLFWTARAAHWADGVALEYAPFGTMLGEDNKPFKTRSGTTVKLKDLLDEAEQRALKVVTEKNPELPETLRNQIAHSVGIGAVKYADLAKDRVADYVFSFDKILALDGNTAPYLQYAHARIRSIFRKSENAKPGEIHLESPFELSLAKHILRLPEILDLVARELKPHHLCTYLYELATRFSGFYENCPVLQSEDRTRASRLALCDLTAKTMALGLDLLGIEHPEQM